MPSLAHTRRPADRKRWANFRDRLGRSRPSRSSRAGGLKDRTPVRSLRNNRRYTGNLGSSPGRRPISRAGSSRASANSLALQRLAHDTGRLFRSFNLIFSRRGAPSFPSGSPASGWPQQPREGTARQAATLKASIRVRLESSRQQNVVASPHPRIQQGKADGTPAPGAKRGPTDWGIRGACGVPKSLDRTTFSMTIAHIKSNALRRTLLVLIVPLLPLLIAGAAALVALCAFADAFIGEFRGGFWRSVRDCWKSAR